MNLEQFTKKVDAISLDKYGIAYTEENGKDCSTLKSAFDDDETADEFVSWWANKYELVTMDEFISTPTPFKSIPSILKDKF